MKQLIFLLFVLFLSLPQISFGGKGKKDISSVKIFLPKTEMVNQDLKSGGPITFCSWNELIDRIEITDNTCSWFKVTITKKNYEFDEVSLKTVETLGEVVLKMEEFRPCDIGKTNKVILKIYPWVSREGDYTILITKESGQDNTMRSMGGEPENEPEEVINFVYSIQSCG